MRQLTVTASDGVRLAVYESGEEGPAVLCVHGYPDDHRLWDGVASLLSPHHRVLTLDVRGAGASQRPPTRAGYRLDQLADDVCAVAELADGPVHLVGHDWGSIQLWHAVSRADARMRFASFTSISGPSLAYSRAWFASRLRLNPAASVEALRQARASWYLGLFLLPRLPERFVTSSRARRSLGNAGYPRTEADAVTGLELYRANMGPGAPRIRPEPSSVPVQVLAPRHDRFVTVALQTGAPRPWVPELRTEVVEGGHWLPARDPELVADRVATFIRTLQEL